MNRIEGAVLMWKIAVQDNQSTLRCIWHFVVGFRLGREEIQRRTDEAMRALFARPEFHQQVIDTLHRNAEFIRSMQAKR